MKKLKVAVVYGGPSTEHEVSKMSFVQVWKNLDRNKYIAEKVYIDKNGFWQIPKIKQKLKTTQALKTIKEKFDLVFICLHGQFGEDGSLQKLLERKEIKYTGSNSKSSATAIDKNLSNKLFKKAGFNVPNFALISNKINLSVLLKRFELPLVVKSINGGSSIGVYICKTISDLNLAIKSVPTPYIIQRLIKGREFTCGVLEKNKKPFALIPTEIIPKSNFFDYKAKYTSNASIEVTPPQLEKKRIIELQELALKAHKILKLSGMSRSDFIYDGNKIYILETNTIPGLTKTSLLPQGAKSLGINYSKMLDLIIESAK